MILLPIKCATAPGNAPPRPSPSSSSPPTRRPTSRRKSPLILRRSPGHFVSNRFRPLILGSVQERSDHSRSLERVGHEPPRLGLDTIHHRYQCGSTGPVVPY